MMFAAQRRMRMLLLALLCFGCSRDLGGSTPPCAVWDVVRRPHFNAPDKLDLLLVVDNSNSMREEQAELMRQLPDLIRVLTTGERHDGTRFRRIQDLRVGVVSTDMGTGGFPVFTCNEPNFGDDGVLRTRGNTMISGCDAEYPQFLSFSPEWDTDVDSFAADVACLAALGTNGCGFEQQLDAMLKALSPSTATDDEGRPLTFTGGRTGHADGANSGFLRPDSVLAVLMLTDEDDCSALDPDIYNEHSARYPGEELNLRCFQYPEAVHRTDRYVNGLLLTRPDPDLLVFAPIVGVPPDLIAPGPFPGSPPDFDVILADPRMQEMPDPERLSQLRPSCRTDNGPAFPPRRIVTVARDLERGGANTSLASICEPNFDAAIETFVDDIAAILAFRGCLPRPLSRRPDGLVGCEILEVLPAEGAVEGAVTRCAELPGRTLRERSTSEYEGEVCVLQQLRDGESGEAGWYYDDSSAEVRDRCDLTPQRIVFTPEGALALGSTWTLGCLEHVSAPVGARGASCALDESVCETANTVELLATNPMGLSCHPESHTCELRCETNADCAAGDTCEDAFCLNPTCR